jgi:hypothetical protein
MSTPSTPSTHSSLQFFAASTTILANILHDRVESLQALQMKGFRTTESATRYLDIEREIGYLTSPMVQESKYNMFIVNTTEDLTSTITILQTTAAVMTAAPDSSIEEYIKNQIRRDMLVSYHQTLSYLMASAQKNLVDEEAESKDAEERDAEERDAEERDAEERDAEERDAEERDAEERDADEEKPIKA